MVIEEYIQNAPEKRRSALERLRQICLDKLQGYEESLVYNMPSYTKKGVVEVAFASQKSYISLYILKEPVMDEYRHNFPKSRIGKGCIRYPNPQKIDFDLVEKMIQHAFESDAPIC
ncbi:MAG: DUF1801 domain-containing protein [Chloroflexi bacterium]|nr:DUF1801 domain-containing protein [Chloroflexota bacterium]